MQAGSLVTGQNSSIGCKRYIDTRVAASYCETRVPYPKVLTHVHHKRSKAPTLGRFDAWIAIAFRSSVLTIHNLAYLVAPLVEDSTCYLGRDLSSRS